MDADKISQLVKEAKKHTDELQSAALDLLDLHDEGSIENERLKEYFDEYESDTFMILKMDYMDIFKKLRLDLDLLNSGLDVRDPEPIPSWMKNPDWLEQSLLDFNGHKMDKLHQKNHIWSGFYVLYDYLERLDRLAEATFEIYKMKSHEISFENGLIFDEANGIEIHEYNKEDDTYRVSECLFKPENKNQWMYWGDIAEYVERDIVANDFEDKVKKRVSDMVRGINNHAIKAINKPIIETDGRFRYKGLH